MESERDKSLELADDQWMKCLNLEPILAEGRICLDDRSLVLSSSHERVRNDVYGALPDYLHPLFDDVCEGTDAFRGKCRQVKSAGMAKRCAKVLPSISQSSSVTQGRLIPIPAVPAVCPRRNIVI